jgi:hypothetical protein
MNREKNIYFGVVRNENSMTELFCNYMQFKIFRDEFSKMFLNESEKATIQYEHFSTQFTLNNNSRPDMAIINDKIDVLIEIKVDNAELTDNQPKSYLKYLSESTKRVKCLIFLIPKGYNSLGVWNKRAEQYFLKEYKVSDIKLKVLYWTDIIKVIEKADLHLISERVNDFYELLKMKFEYKNILFDQSEVSYMYRRDIPIILTKLYAVIEEVSKHGFLDMKKEVRFDTQEYAIYFKDDKGDYILYFGLWHPFWEKHSQPLCFGVEQEYYSQKAVKRFNKIHKDDLIEFWDEDTLFKLCTIDENIISHEDCTSKIVDIINNELKALVS